MHTKDYLNNEIREEIEKKGFSIYNYISLKELLLTVNKDFLAFVASENYTHILIALSMIFMLPLAFVIHLFVTQSKLGLLLTMLVFYTFVYIAIFIYLIIKLLFRTYKFSKITNILYTKKGLIIDNKIFHYEEDEKLKNLLLDYEKLFDEYLSKSSKLSENISFLKKNISNELIKNSKDKKDWFSYTLIFIFYYLGIILGFFFFFIFFFFISLYFKINKSVELKIKDNMTIIDNKIKKLDEIYHLLNNQISNFKDGKISNLSKKIDKDMNKFYENINTILSQKDTLKTIIEQSIYKDFIDFEYLAFYIKTQFNKPLTDVINLMSDYKSKVDNQIDEIKNHLKNSDEKENYQVEQKLINLQTIQKNINLYLDKLELSLQ
ncbi:hypothetical protein [Aliarcobacter butzleri]|uniref:hypothetical protein n=1 Tax=Aliarcobacter butzleri TaxID=28197 RepID=UPI001EDA5C0E|nr:hypothetical protein [Aliarcobacter butzleri]MCG3692278.1 hypothetical protein [Aliarcobacter butzleri]